MVKNPPANAGDMRDAGSIPGSGTSPVSDWHSKVYTPTCLYCWPNPQTYFISFLFSLLHQQYQETAHDTSIIINEVSLSDSLNKIAIAQYSISAPEKLYQGPKFFLIITMQLFNILTLILSQIFQLDNYFLRIVSHCCMCQIHYTSLHFIHCSVPSIFTYMNSSGGIFS